MSFLTPWFLAGALAVVVPVVLHLLRRNPEQRVKFAAVKLLKDAPVEHTARRRLRELVLLALRVATLALLAFAFARPFLRSANALAPGAVTVIALDTSYSMSAPGRFELAQRLAKDRVARAPAGDQIAVVTFGDTADVVSKPSADRALAIAAIDRASPGFGATRYRTALNAAVQALAHRRGTVVVVTDLQENGWDAGDQATVPDSTRIEIADVGPLPPNLAVASLRQTPDGILATIRSTDANRREARVRLTVDGRQAAQTSIAIGPNQSADITFPGARGTDAAVSVDDTGGIQADNVRFAVLGGAAAPPVLVVTGSGDLDRDAYYVRRALGASGDGGRGLDVGATSAAQLAGWTDAQLAGQSAVVLLSTRGLERRGREALGRYVTSGGGMLIAAGPEIDPDVIADVLGAGTRLQIVPPDDRASISATLAPADARHPVFQAFGVDAASLGLVRFQKIARISGSTCQAIARFTTGEPALVDCGAGEGRVLVLASDLNNRWNDFPLHGTFVPFLHESMRYISNAKPRSFEYLVGEAPAGLPAKPGIVIVPDAARGSKSAGRHVAVNVDPEEGDPARLSVEAFQAAVVHLKDLSALEMRVEAAEQEDRQHLWQYALVVMIGVLALEGIVASRC